MNDLSTHYLVPHNLLRKDTLDDTIEYVSNIMGFKVPYHKSTFTPFILSLLIACSFISAEELSLYLGIPREDNSKLRHMLNNVEQKGLIKIQKLSQRDSGSKQLYYLSENGFSQGIQNYDDILIEYRRKGKEITTKHDFSVGMNIFHFILFGHPFTYAREVSYGLSRKTSRKVSSTLCVDGQYGFEGNSKMVYLEEDLCNEKPGELVDKIDRYNTYGLMDDSINSTIIFSFRQSGIYFDQIGYEAFNIRLLTQLLNEMRDTGELLLSTKVSMLLCMKEEEYNEVDRTIISLAREIGYLDKNNNRVRSKDMTADELEKYISDLDNKRNLYKLKYVNEQQYQIASKRFRSVAGVIALKYNKSPEYSNLYLEKMLMGYSVWCVPTDLLVNYLPIITADMFGYMKEVESKVRTNNPSFTYICAISKPFAYSNNKVGSMVLKHIFKDRDRNYALEYISRDLGALFRATKFSRYFLNRNDNTTLVCLVDTFSDAIFAIKSSFMNYGSSTFVSDGSSANDIVFLLKKDLDHGNLRFFKLVNENPVFIRQ